jgi:hypothetical protein
MLVLDASKGHLKPEVTCVIHAVNTVDLMVMCEGINSQLQVLDLGF